MSLYLSDISIIDMRHIQAYQGFVALSQNKTTSLMFHKKNNCTKYLALNKHHVATAQTKEYVIYIKNSVKQNGCPQR